MLHPVVKCTMEEGNTSCFASTMKSVLYADLENSPTKICALVG